MITILIYVFISILISNLIILLHWLIILLLAPLVLLPVEVKLLLHSSLVVKEGLLLVLVLVHVPARVHHRASYLFSGGSLL